MNTIKAAYNGNPEVTAIQYDGTRECAIAISQSDYFNGSISFEKGEVHTFSAFDLFTGQYRKVYPGDYFIICNGESAGKDVVTILVTSTAFQVLFAPKE